jgi:AcrR family transcriptional regulator
VKNRRVEPRGRPRSVEADAAILAAALALFVERGAEGASIEQIAKRAGVTRATVYRRWPTKEALLAQAIAQLRERVEQAGPVRTGAQLGELLAWLVDALPRALADPAARTLLARLIAAGASDPALVSTYWRTVLEPRRRALGRTLVAEREQGRLPARLDPELVQDLIAGALLWYVLVRPGGRSEREIRAYLRRVLRQLGVPLSVPRSRRAVDTR